MLCLTIVYFQFFYIGLIYEDPDSKKEISSENPRFP